MSIWRWLSPNSPITKTCDTETCLRSLDGKLYHMSGRSSVARSTPADANESRDWRIYAGCAQTLMASARRLYARHPMGVDLEQSLYALESTAIGLCLKLFPWARFSLQTTPQSVAVATGLAPVH